MTHFSSSATNAHPGGTLKDIYKSIFAGYLKARGPNVNIVMTCLLRKQPWQSTLNVDIVCTKSHLLNFSSVCIKCGNSNATKVEVDKHILFQTIEKKTIQLSTMSKGIYFLEPYCSEVYLLNQHYLQIWPAVKACSKGSQHDQKKRS